MRMRQFRTQKPSLLQSAGAAVAGLLLATTACQAGLFVGDFAPANWVFTPGGPGGDGSFSYAVWTPLPPDPAGSVAVYAAHQFAGTTTLSLTLPNTTPGYVVNFRSSFFNPTGGNDTQALLMNAPGYPAVSLGSYPTPDSPPGPVINNFSVTLHAGETIEFAMFSDTTNLGDKKNVPYFLIDQWSVSPIPEASTWLAACGLVAVCLGQVWRTRKNTSSAQPQGAA